MRTFVLVFLFLSVNSMLLNAKTGQQLYAQCSGCHGQEGDRAALGKSNLLQGQSLIELIQKLNDYRNKERNNKGMGLLMTGQVNDFSDKDIVNVATYISAFKKHKTIVKNLKEETSTIDLNNNGNRLTLIYPPSVEKGEDFTIYIKLTNNALKKKNGGITLSFPEQKNFNGEVVARVFDNITEFSPPKKMYNKLANASKAIRYSVIEGWETEWSPNSHRYMKIKLTFPKENNSFVINFRGILIDNKKEEVLIPKNAKRLDQQGYPIEQIKIYAKEQGPPIPLLRLP